MKNKKFIAVMIMLVLCISVLFIGCKDDTDNHQQDTTNQTQSQPSSTEQTESQSEITEQSESQQNSTEQTEPQPDIKEQSSSEQSSEAEPQKDEIKVENAYIKRGKFNLEGSNASYSYDYRLPRIVDDSEDANKINKEIQDNLIPLAKNQVKLIDEGEYPEFLKVTWRAEKGSNTISLIIKGDNGMSYVDYLVYCYDTQTQTWLTSEKLLKQFNLTKQAYLDSVVKAAQEQFLKTYPTPKPGDEGYDKAMADEQKSAYESIAEYITFESVQPFIDKNDELKVYAPVAEYNTGDTYGVQLLSPSF